MPLYPQSPRPTTPYPFRSNRPAVGGGPVWAPQIRALTQYGLAEADLVYKVKSYWQIKTLYDFFESVSGVAGRFTFIDFNGVGTIGGTDPGVPWGNLFVAKGDASATSWDLPTYAIKAQMTTVSASLTAGAVTVTPASMSGITLGEVLTAVNADGTGGEVVTVTAVTATTFTATFGSNKAANWLVQAPLVFENGVAKTTKWNNNSPGAGNYGIKAGLGTDGVDKLYAGTAPASSVLVTVAAMCRRALRKARFANPSNPFLYEVPAVYAAGPVTIVEVRK